MGHWVAAALQGRHLRLTIAQDPGKKCEEQRDTPIKATPSENCCSHRQDGLDPSSKGAHLAVLAGLRKLRLQLLDLGLRQQHLTLQRSCPRSSAPPADLA